MILTLMKMMISVVGWKKIRPEVKLILISKIRQIAKVAVKAVIVRGQKLLYQMMKMKMIKVRKSSIFDLLIKGEKSHIPAIYMYATLSNILKRFLECSTFIRLN